MGLFILFYKLIRKERKGQAAPLLILLIAVVLVCMMVVFNIGKVSLNRVDTQNAADAGALASASWLASGQNYIADTSQAMFARSLGFIAMMAALGHGGAFWEPGGVVAIYALIEGFSAYQITVMIAAKRSGKMACEQAREQGKAYAFYNAGVDEYKEPEPGEDYQTYKERDGRFSQWLKDKGYKSGIYQWEDSKYRYWDSRTQSWVVYKEDTTNEVRVSVDSPSSFSLMPGALSGYSISWVPEPLPKPPTPIWVVFVVPAFISSMSPGNPDTTVITTRKEPEADLQLWKLNIPDITSGARAKTTGGGSIYLKGGTYDCRLAGAW